MPKTEKQQNCPKCGQPGDPDLAGVGELVCEPCNYIWGGGPYDD